MRPGTAVPILVIFDFDNTLIDSRINFTGLREALVNLLATAGPLPSAREELMRLPLRGLADRAEAASPDLGRAAWATIEAFEAEGLQDAPAMPHARQVLAALSARGFRLALLTNNGRAATVRLLGHQDLAPLFDVVVTRDDVATLKPDPAGIHLILHRLGPVRAAYLVGDSWIDGLAAAASGIRFVGVGPRRAEVEARGVRPWAWVSDLRTLLDLDWEG